MIDLHSHLLPGVDDGSRSVEQSRRVLASMAAAGVTEICLTPHLLASQAPGGVPREHDRAFTALTAGDPVPVRLHRGAEVMLDRPLSEEAAADPAIRIAGTRWILVEFPRLVTAETVENALAHVVKVGLLPLLAHPERYSSCSPGTAWRWRKTGARLQVDATTLLSPRPRGERARALLAAGLADILAADNHGDDRSIVTASRLLESQDAVDQAGALCERNPRAILEDRELELVEPATVRLSLGSRLRRLFDSDEP